MIFDVSYDSFVLFPLYTYITYHYDALVVYLVYD